MNLNISSRREALSLLDKLHSEESSVHAVLQSSTGAVARISGFLGGSSTGKDLVVLRKDDSAYLSVPFADRAGDFRFEDKRGLSETLRATADKWGNCSLALEFKDGDSLTFIFDLP